MKPIEGALEYARAGCYVFPITPNEKYPPLVKWKNQSTTDRERIQQWARMFPDANWAMNCEKSGLLILDVDIGAGKTGDDSFQELDLIYGPLPPTLVVKTPSGGRHYYFGGLAPSSVSKIGKNLDIKSIGGYVLCVGSIVKGVRYEIV